MYCDLSYHALRAQFGTRKDKCCIEQQSQVVYHKVELVAIISVDFHVLT